VPFSPSANGVIGWVAEVDVDHLCQPDRAKSGPEGGAQKRTFRTSRSQILPGLKCLARVTTKGFALSAPFGSSADERRLSSFSITVAAATVTRLRAIVEPGAISVLPRPRIPPLVDEGLVLARE
jgi:hypothetical protein